MALSSVQDDVLEEEQLKSKSQLLPCLLFPAPPLFFVGRVACTSTNCTISPVTSIATAVATTIIVVSVVVVVSPIIVRRSGITGRPIARAGAGSGARRR